VCVGRQLFSFQGDDLRLAEAWLRCDYAGEPVITDTALIVDAFKSENFLGLCLSNI
jgi:hypothetical protein